MLEGINKNHLIKGTREKQAQGTKHEDGKKKDIKYKQIKSHIGENQNSQLETNLTNRHPQEETLWLTFSLSLPLFPFFFSFLKAYLQLHKSTLNQDELPYFSSPSPFIISQSSFNACWMESMPS